MKCYFQGCNEDGETKEHIPPRSFFPEGEKVQLLTVRSCKKHNNAKSVNDIYVLAHICMNASPNNRAREVFVNKVAPQLSYNNDALRKLLLNGAVQSVCGAVKYQVDHSRFDDFFTALSCGIVFKSCGSSLPVNYRHSHIYHNFLSDADDKLHALQDTIGEFYSGEPMGILEFGDPETKNERIYTVTIFGVPGFKSSVTLVHNFFGVFKVTSMLTNLVEIDA